MSHRFTVSKTNTSSSLFDILEGFAVPNIGSLNSLPAHVDLPQIWRKGC
jgi:hypothetical protein